MAGNSNWKRLRILNALSLNFQNVKAVEKKTVAFAGIAAGGRGGFRIEAPASDEVDASLYGGGRRGQGQDSIEIIFKTVLIKSSKIGSRLFPTSR